MNTIDALFATKKAAQVRKMTPPYIFQYFNICGLHVSTGSAVKSSAHLINPLIHVLNEEPHLPKYIVVLPDQDILQLLVKHHSTSALVIGSILHFMIKQMDLFIARRKQDLFHRRPGALSADGLLPRFIWIRMLKRPKSLSEKDIFSLRGKFNSILKECLLDGNEKSHHIMSIEVDDSKFDLSGMLTSSGKADFWAEVNRALEKFDKGEIMLKLRRTQPTAMQSSHPNDKKKRENFKISQSGITL